MLFDKQRQLETAVLNQMANNRTTENPTKCDDHVTLARMVQTKSFDILRTVTRTLTPDDVLRNYPNGSVKNCIFPAKKTNGGVLWWNT